VVVLGRRASKVTMMSITFDLIGDNVDLNDDDDDVDVDVDVVDVDA